MIAAIGIDLREHHRAPHVGGRNGHQRPRRPFRTLAVAEFALRLRQQVARLQVGRPRLDHLLEHLARNRGRALSRRQLLDGAWGADWYGDERTVDVHVRQLRKKLGEPLHLTTVWGVGYRLD